MAFYHNGKVKPENHISPLVLMPHEDQPEEEILSVDELIMKGR